MKTKQILSFLKHLLILITVSALLTSCESRRIIVNALDEKEANEILVFLSNKGLDAQKVQVASEGGGGGGKAILWNISVESSQANEAMALLNQAGLPRRRGQNLLGIFSNSGLVPSGMQEKVRYQAGLAEQIASTIRKIDGVLDADVQISFPEEDPLNPTAAKQKITASVYVKHNGILDDPNAHLVTRIKRLVAGSINGLDYDYVTVIGDRARFGDSASGPMSTFGEEGPQLVNVWSIILAQNSLTRFRILFFTLVTTLVLLTLALIWLLWKFYPILKHKGGFKELFSYHPVHVEDLSAPVAVAKVAEEVKEETKETKEEENPNKGIDET
jgi:type III secretion protein J